MIKNIANWKKWSLASFVVTGLAYSFTAIWGHVPIIDHLDIGYRICVGIFSSIVFSSVTGGVVIVLNYCHQRKMTYQEKLLEEISAANDDIMLQVNPTHARVSIALSSSPFNVRQHTRECNRLVEGYCHETHATPADANLYLRQANSLQQQYLATHPVNEVSYLEELSVNGYRYNQTPREIIQNSKPSCHKIQVSNSLEISPPEISPGHSNISFSF